MTNEQIKIAIVEDDEALCELIARRLNKEGHSCFKLRSAAETLAWFKANKADILLLDLKLPDASGEDLIASLQAIGVTIPFIVATGQGSEDTAVRLLKQGARDYLVKNAQFLDALPNTIAMAWREVQLEALLAKARERIRLQNATLSAINEFSPDGILSVRPDGSISSCNAALISDWELTEADIDKGAMHVFSAIAVKTGDPDAFLKSVLSVSDDFKGVASREVRAGERVFELFSAPIEQGGRVWFFHDFTLHKRAEERLQAAKEQTEANAKTRSMFFAVVSHDVRTPLNSISGFISLLESTRLDAQQQEYLKIVRASCEHLLILINDILDLSRLEHGVIELDSMPMSPALLIEECLDTFIPASAESGVELRKELSPDLPENIHGDQLRLRQILINLIGNAMKFTRKGAVTVACRPAPDAPGFLEFQIRDTGIGIPKEVQKSLFEPFNQGGMEITKEYGGSGLGLSISKQLIERMGGKLSLESEPGVGSTFIFTIGNALKPKD